MSGVFVCILFLIGLFLPNKIRKLGFIIAASISFILLVSFVVRPYWVDYQVSKKMEQLNQYLEKKYPNEQWEITRQIGRQYNPYHLNVEFENENGWFYTYSMVDINTICQKSWAPPEGKFPGEGKHYEGHCE